MMRVCAIDKLSESSPLGVVARKHEESGVIVAGDVFVRVDRLFRGVPVLAYRSEVRRLAPVVDCIVEVGQRGTRGDSTVRRSEQVMTSI